MIPGVPIFSPNPEAAARLLADLDDCSLSFDELARRHGTTTDALALWLSTDDIKDRLQQSLDAMALRTRRLATSRLPAATRVISHIVESSPVLSERGLDFNSPDYRAEREYRRRHNESIRRACSVLLRLANFFSPTHAPIPRAPGRGPEVADPPGRTLQDDEGSERPPTTGSAPSNKPHRPQLSVETLAGLLKHWEATDGADASRLEAHHTHPSRASTGRAARHTPPANGAAPHTLTSNQGSQSRRCDRSTGESSFSASPALSAVTSSPPTAVAEPRPPPIAGYQRPRQRFKARR